MTAKKKSLAVVVAMAAMTVTTAVPAFAQEEGEVAAHPVGPAEGGQYAPAGETQQEALPALAPVVGSGQYAPGAAAQGGEDCILTTYPEQPCPPQEAKGSGQYAPGTPASSSDVRADPSEQATITGEFSVKEGGWSFVTDEETGQEYYLVGTIGLDPQATAGKRVVARGVAECGYDGPVYGCTLGVSSIEPVAEGAERENAPAEPAAPTDETAPDEQTIPFEVPTPDEDGDSPERQDGTGADDKGTVVVSGDTSNTDKGGGSVDAGGSGSVVASGGAGQSGASPMAKVLPATGGVLPIAGAAGLLIAAAGLLVRKISR